MHRIQRIAELDIQTLIKLLNKHCITNRQMKISINLTFLKWHKSDSAWMSPHFAHTINVSCKRFPTLISQQINVKCQFLDIFLITSSFISCSYQTRIYLLRVNNTKIRIISEICSNLRMKASERRGLYFWLRIYFTSRCSIYFYY